MVRTDFPGFGTSSGEQEKGRTGERKKGERAMGADQFMTSVPGSRMYTQYTRSVTSPPKSFR